MIKEAIAKLVEKQSLTKDEAADVMDEIMEGRTTPSQLGAFLTALRIKGEVPEEIAGFAGVMRQKAIPVTVSGPLIDIVGTGGDGLNTFNISTTTAFVVAGAGLKVAKHGNRAASSRCGSADVLEALGIKIDLNAVQVQECIEKAGIGFMFAQVFHPSMKYASGTRKEIGIRTVFNILGPLTNPARAAHQLLGVPGKELGDKMIQALSYMDIKHALVVHGLNGMDELTISGKSMVWEINNGKIIRLQQVISPEDAGLNIAGDGYYQGGTAADNAEILRSILSGETGPKRDLVLFNAAAALLAGDKVDTLREGVSLAADVINKGLALDKLNQLITCSQKTVVAA
jgi:anthranilate phosphoribosyltransferase